MVNYMKNNLKDYILMNIKNNKTNLLIVLVLIIFQILVIVGASYYSSIKNFWNEFMSNSYEFDLVYIIEENLNNREALVKKLKENTHVKDVFQYDEFISFGTLKEFQDENKNGEIELFGTISGVKKIVLGKDIEKNFEMICPANFYPDSLIYNNNSNYNYKNSISLRDKLDQKLKMNFIGTMPIELKLVGIFDDNYDFSSPNVCYVSHDTLKQLNLKYQKDLEVQEMPIYILLDDIQNADVLLDYEEITEYTKMKEINREVGDKVIRITGISTLLFGLCIGLLIYFLFMRRVKNESRNIAILSLVGFSKKKIKKLYYFEIIILYVMSFVVALIISYFIAFHFVEWFLWNSPSLSLIKVVISKFAIFGCLIINILLLLISSKKSLSKIDELNISELIYE